MHLFSRRQFSLYSANQLDAWLNALGFSLSKPGDLAREVMNLSNIYNAGQGSPQIWNNKAFIAAYLVYFQPLNFLRMQQVIADGAQRGFWENIKTAIDFGAGLGTFEHALRSLKEHTPHLQTIEAIEPGAEAIQWRERTGLNKITPAVKSSPSETLYGFSYSLNEMKSLPAEALSAEALLFLEPSTITAGRRLQELRGELIGKGFHAWAPCLHQKECPLLKHSQRDWCHTRIHVEMPDWFLAIENQLPMKNNSVTYSYLLMRKTPPPSVLEQEFRVIGDTLFEKGKVRQAVCRDDRRQFLSWLKKEGEPPVIARGAHIEIAGDIIHKADEIRPGKGEIKIR